MSGITMKIRNPFLVIIWSLGLFVLMHVWQYLGSLIAARMSNATFESVISGKFISPLTIFILGFIAAFVGIPLVVVIVKFLWRRSFSWMCFQLEGKHFFKGFLWGLIFPAIILAVFIFIGNASITRFPSRFPTVNSIFIILGSFGLTLFTSISEEVVFRAMIVREIAVKWNWLIASLLGGIVFGFMHLLSILNKVTIINALWILLAAVIASILFTAMYVRFHSLWVPIGFHMGWNFCLQAILGTTMSGKESTFGMFTSNLSGNMFITGGQFGIEASILTMLFYVTIAFFLTIKIGQGKIVLLNKKIIN